MPLSETDPRRRHKFSIAKKISTGSAGHKIRRRFDIGSFSIKPTQDTGLIPPSTPDGFRLAASFLPTIPGVIASSLAKLVTPTEDKEAGDEVAENSGMLLGESVAIQSVKKRRIETRQGNDHD